MDPRRTIAGLVLLASIAGCSGGGGDDDGVAGTAGTAPDATATDPGEVPGGPSGTGSTGTGGAIGATDGTDGTGAGDADAAVGAPGATGPADAEPATADLGTGSDGGVATTLPGPEAPVPAPQPGVLTAGDHDDQLNPGPYRRYANRYLQGAGVDLPVVDVERRVTIAVEGADGVPYPGAHVSASDPVGQDDQGGQGGQGGPGGPLVALATPSDGLAHLYPGLDDLPDAFDVTVTDRLGDVVETVTVRPDELDGSRRVAVRLPATAAPPAALDLALVIDTTGSMGDELEYLKAELSSIVRRIADASPGIDVRVGLVAYRDDGDEYVVRSAELTDDVALAQASLAAERADGGGDYPEAMDRAMDAMLDLGWREDAVRVALLVADAPPHADRARATFDASLEARSRMIHVVPIAASGVADEAQYLMRAMATVTQARYLFLTDDSGVGLPKEEPDVECYLVTRLDGLIVRTVRSLAEGVRVEPSEDEVVRRVGEYDAGRCLVDGQ